MDNRLQRYMKIIYGNSEGIQLTMNSFEHISKMFSESVKIGLNNKIRMNK